MTICAIIPKDIDSETRTVNGILYNNLQFGSGFAYFEEFDLVLRVYNSNDMFIPKGSLISARLVNSKELSGDEKTKSMKNGEKKADNYKMNNVPKEYQHKKPFHLRDEHVNSSDLDVAIDSTKYQKNSGPVKDARHRKKYSRDGIIKKTLGFLNRKSKFNQLSELEGQCRYYMKKNKEQEIEIRMLKKEQAILLDENRRMSKQIKSIDIRRNINDE